MSTLIPSEHAKIGGYGFEIQRVSFASKHIVAVGFAISSIGPAITLTVSIIETVVSAPFALIALAAQCCHNNHPILERIIDFNNESAHNIIFSLFELEFFNLILGSILIPCFNLCKDEPAIPPTSPTQPYQGGAVVGLPAYTSGAPGQPYGTPPVGAVLPYAV